MRIDNGLKARLRRQLSSGELILFTGAGFSRGANTPDGVPISSVYDLRAELWRLAFPNVPADQDSTLGDVFDVALTRARNAVRDVLTRTLTADPSQLPERYRAWFSLPWYRHYTLNLDDLDEAVASHFSLPRDVKAVAGHLDEIPASTLLASVHINGRLRDFPHVTFSAPQYGERLARPEVWMQTLAADILSHPVVFVGTVLDEPGLWQQIELRRQRGNDLIELRPPSYLITPSLPAARAALLKRFNVDWIEATEEEFFHEVLTDVAAESELGHQAIQRRHGALRGRAVIRTINECRSGPIPEDLPSFLMGREPSWADLTSGYAVVRHFEPALLRDVLDARPQVALITGTAAVGKSTTAMRLALGLEAAGKKVMVLDLAESAGSVGATASAVRSQAPDVLFVDDVDLFGEAAGRFIREVAFDAPTTVIAAVRSSRAHSLDLNNALEELHVLERTVPSLENSDIDLLVDALSRANRLGRLTGMSPSDRQRVFREQCGRQLLVGMYAATSGELLQDKVRSECEDLDGHSRLAYGMAALATAERHYVLRDEIVIGLGAVSGVLNNATLNIVNELVRRGLLVSGRDGLRLRHRWIAETAVEVFQDNGVVGQPLRALAVALANKSDPQGSPKARERALLRRLLNHDYLQRLTADLGVVRQIYAEVEPYLAWDYHFWLQRGSLEVETGDLAVAETFLLSARGLAPDQDYRVQTEYAYLLLKKAAKTPRSPKAADWAEAGLSDLEHAIASRGKEDAYFFHVYGSQGLSWSRRAPLLPQQRVALVQRLKTAVDRGVELHPRRADLQQLAKDLQREYLMLAVEPKA